MEETKENSAEVIGAICKGQSRGQTGVSLGELKINTTVQLSAYLSLGKAGSKVRLCPSQSQPCLQACEEDQPACRFPGRLFNSFTSQKGRTEKLQLPVF